jgi:uncharacterized BrkB/YihY/UPF0761 family membrane protein
LDHTRACIVNFTAGDGSIYAAAIAFYALVSMIPFAAVLLAIGGAVLASVGRNSPTQFNQMLDDVVRAVRYLDPFVPERDLRDILTSLIGMRGNLGLLGTLALLVAASQVVNTIRAAVARPFGIDLEVGSQKLEPQVLRSLRTAAVVILRRLKTLFWLSVVGFLMGGIRVVLATAASVVRLTPPQYLSVFLNHPLLAPVVSQASGALFCFVGYNAALIHVARRQTTWNARALGGVVFSLLQAAAEVVYSRYVEHWSSLSLSYGSLASLAAVALWTFYFSCVFLISVELTAIVSHPARLYLNVKPPE